jgi:hypothetical protein
MQKAVSAWAQTYKGAVRPIGIEKNLLIRMPARIATRNVAGKLPPKPLAAGDHLKNLKICQMIRLASAEVLTRSWHAASFTGTPNGRVQKITRAIAQNDVRDHVGPFPN